MGVINVYVSLLLLLIYQNCICSGIYNGKFVAETEETDAGLSVITTYSTKFPYMIEILKDGVHSCGATLIKRNIALTAAHCTPENYTDDDLRRMTLVAGIQLAGYIRGPMVQWRDVKKIVDHQLFSHIRRDIALIQTDRDFLETDYVKPINLPEGYGINSFNGEDVVQLGWGMKEDLQDSDILLQIQGYVKHSRLCVSEWKNTWAPHEHTLLCIQGYRKGVLCFGDSGGPTVIHNPHDPSKDVVIGVTTTGFHYEVGVDPNIVSHCDPTKPSLVANVAMFSKWINKTISTQLKS